MGYVPRLLRVGPVGLSHLVGFDQYAAYHNFVIVWPCKVKYHYPYTYFACTPFPLITNHWVQFVVGVTWLNEHGNVTGGLQSLKPSISSYV